MLKSSTIEKFAETLHGRLILPDDADYDDARAIYNGMIDKRPRLIAQCANVADVIAAVAFSRQQRLDTAIRGGGHNPSGLALCDDGLVIDLSQMNGVRIDPKSRTVRAEGGAIWGKVDHAANAFGLGSVNGIFSTTGVGGLTLVGGHGYLSRRYGLTIDNLLEADVVLADGSFVTASEEENPDLFWALRGGGGNFGVVTSFLFRLHPVGTVVGGPTLWPIDAMEDILRWYDDFIRNAPRDLNGFFAVLTVPSAAPFPEVLQGKRVCGVVWCYTGPKEGVDEVFAPVHEAGDMAMNGLAEMPYYALQSAFNAFYPSGLQGYWKGHFVNELSDEAIDVHLNYGTELPTPLATMHLYPIDGAVHDVGQNDSAWSFRNSRWSCVIAAYHEDPKNNEHMSKWVRDYWKALRPYSAEAGYLNFDQEFGEDSIRKNYGSNYNQLRKIKAQYDPENFFHMNHNIEPET
jgi:FAD/FMN-containing dehydrogenase